MASDFLDEAAENGAVVDLRGSDFHGSRSRCVGDLFDLRHSQLTLALKREVALEIPYSEIQSVSVNEDGLNYRVTITTLGDTIRLTTQQKELMGFRTSAMLRWDGIKFIYGSDDTWHGRNLDATLADLAKLAG